MKIQEQPQQPRWYQSRLTWVLLGFIAIGGFFLLTEHTAHVLGLFLLCPLMILFMHGGHGGHGEFHDQSQHQPPEGGQP